MLTTIGLILFVLGALAAVAQFSIIVVTYAAVRNSQVKGKVNIGLGTGWTAVALFIAGIILVRI